MFEQLADIGLWIRQALGPWAEPPLSAVTIVAVCSVLTLIHFGTQRAMVNVKELAEHYREVAEWRKEFFKARRTGDHKLMAKLMKRQAYINKLSAEIAAKMTKPMLIYIIPLWIIFLILYNVFQGNVVYFPLLNQGLPFWIWYFVVNGSLVPVIQRLLGLSYTSTD
ncbi:MAG: EMC3/TMCO1 family protein [Candidatus Nezhaarchaeota archaeon]|nr:EMC3/TMCO1 family protein [Candidatus Nezhaarchaeota archaeon]